MELVVFLELDEFGREYFEPLPDKERDAQLKRVLAKAAKCSKRDGLARRVGIEIRPNAALQGEEE
jgi:hypothetical protein